MAYEPYHIPSGSMKPTLHVGDFIMVEKFSYGVKLPLSDVYLSPPTLPKRGDVIVFSSVAAGPKINLIKRVVAVPGDTIEIREGQVILNGKNIEYSHGEMSGASKVIYRTHTNSPEIKSHLVQFSKGPGQLRNLPPVVVPQGRLFVLGDNRDNSSDSRVWGFVPFKNVKGKAKLVWMNLSYPWEKSIRRFKPERIGTVI